MSSRLVLIGYNSKQKTVKPIDAECYRCRGVTPKLQTSAQSVCRFNTAPAFTLRIVSLFAAARLCSRSSTEAPSPSHAAIAFEHRRAGTWHFYRAVRLIENFT